MFFCHFFIVWFELMNEKSMEIELNYLFIVRVVRGDN